MGNCSHPPNESHSPCTRLSSQVRQPHFYERYLGYGHGAEFWKADVSELRLVGYDYVMSIEHEDGLMRSSEGLTKAIEALKDALISEDKGELFYV